MQMVAIRKYPSTPHIEGSRLQPGDSTAGQVSFGDLLRQWPEATFISEEKVDGGQAGIFVDENLDLRLQSRGHVLTGGAGEAQFSQLKEWVAHHERWLMERLEDRYVMYGECMFARHTIFYDQLPHIFLEFDILDRQTNLFLSTSARRRLLGGGPVASVPVLSEAPLRNRAETEKLITRSLYQSPEWRERLHFAARRAGVDPELAIAQSADTDRAEGIYLKVEIGDETVARFKWVRPGFLQTILDSGTHWKDRAIIRNELAADVDIFAQALPAQTGPDESLQP